MERNGYNIVADKALNRLNIQLSGTFSIEDALPLINRINAEVVKLREGFDVINDVRELKFVDSKAAKEIKKGTAIMQSKGAKIIIRVVGSSKFALVTFAKFSNFNNSNMKIYYAPTLEDAYKILEEK
jgi:anti-anti-sigma regulatory factor